MQLQETILCNTLSSPSQSSSSGSLTFHDIRTGSILASFKQTNAKSHCTDVLETRDAQGGFMMAAQSEKSILYVYNYQKDQVALKIIMPERVSCIAIDPKGSYCAGGTSQGKIYFWEIASGILFSSWDAHYRQVNILRFTQDSAVLVSGSDDSSVSIWSVSRLLDEDIQSDLVTPLCTLSDHTLPVTDIVCGVGPFPTCRILTSSVDHSVKLWDPSSKSLLLSTFQFPKAISTLAWDIAERFFFAASPDGSIHQVNLFSQRSDMTGEKVMEAVGGAGANDIILVDGEGSRPTKKRLINVGHPVTAMTISLTGSNLLVGTETGVISIYDVPSHQLLRTISSHKGMSITYLKTMIKPVDLIGHVSLSLHVGSTLDTKDIIPVRPVAPFQRIKDVKIRSAHQVSMMLAAHEAPSITSDYAKEELLKDYSFFVQSTTSESPGVSLRSQVTELENEVTTLREQLGKAKGVNDMMWETIVQQLIPPSGRAREHIGDELEEESTQRRKRGRV